MAILGTYVKQPIDKWDYDIRYSEWMTPTDGLSDQVEPVVTVEPEGLEIEAVIRDYENRRVKIWVSGGVSGQRYKVEVTTLTSEGRRLQDEFYIVVRDF